MTGGGGITGNNDDLYFDLYNNIFNNVSSSVFYWNTNYNLSGNNCGNYYINMSLIAHNKVIQNWIIDTKSIN